MFVIQFVRIMKRTYICLKQALSEIELTNDAMGNVDFLEIS